MMKTASPLHESCQEGLTYLCTVAFVKQLHLEDKSILALFETSSWLEFTILLLCQEFEKVALPFHCSINSINTSTLKHSIGIVTVF